MTLLINSAMIHSAIRATRTAARNAARAAAASAATLEAAGIGWTAALAAGGGLQGPTWATNNLAESKFNYAPCQARPARCAPSDGDRRRQRPWRSSRGGRFLTMSQASAGVRGCPGPQAAREGSARTPPSGCVGRAWRGSAASPDAHHRGRPSVALRARASDIRRAARARTVRDARAVRGTRLTGSAEARRALHALHERPFVGLAADAEEVAVQREARERCAAYEG